MERDQRRAEFLDNLQRFRSERGKTQFRMPVVHKVELDLYELFRLTQSFGGYATVVKKIGSWSTIWRLLPNYNPRVTDASNRLKKNYEKYLLDYEVFLHQQARAAEALAVSAPLAAVPVTIAVTVDSTAATAHATIAPRRDAGAEVPPPGSPTIAEPTASAAATAASPGAESRARPPPSSPSASSGSRRAKRAAPVAAGPLVVLCNAIAFQESSRGAKRSRTAEREAQPDTHDAVSMLLSLRSLAEQSVSM